MNRPQVFVLFTIDCETAGRGNPLGPADWDVSGRVIDAFTTTVLNGGYLPTVLATPEAADAHSPLFQDVPSGGGEVGLLIHPTTLRDTRHRGFLGGLPSAAQAETVRIAVDRYAGHLGRRPLTARSTHFSANDDTFAVLADAGFRQSSISSPGRVIAKHHARWDGAVRAPHFASASSRLEAGHLPVLEIPVTTDDSQRRDGVAPELRIETGTVPEWQAPLIRAQLARQVDDRESHLVLVFVTTTRSPFHDRSDRVRQTLDALTEFLDELDEEFEMVPTTPSQLHRTIAGFA